MRYTHILKTDNLKLIFLSILFSFHIFFWDIKLINNYGLRELISLVILYLLYELIKNDFLILKKNKKNIVYISLIISFFSIHLFLNNNIDNRILHIQSLQGLIGISILLFIIFFYYEFIEKNMNKFINIFLTIFFTSFLFADLTTSTLDDINYLCASYLKITNKIIFQENSHLAMVFTACIGYLIIKNKDKSFLFHLCLFFPVLFTIYFQSSATFYLSAVILISLILILEFNFFIKKYIFVLLIYTSLLFLTLFIDDFFKSSKFDFYLSCNNKISENSLGITKYLNNKLNVLETSEELNDQTKLNQIKKFKIQDTSETVYELFLNQKIDKNVAYPDLPRQYPSFTFNLSTAVLLNALNISFETLKNRPFGWGLNRYEYAFDYYMFNNVVIPYWYHEVYTLNYNDGSANIPKLITEFGIISFLLIPITIMFFINRKIKTELKIFILILILTQLIRGAGFFNGGFMFSLVFMVFTVFSFFKKND